MEEAYFSKGDQLMKVKLLFDFSSLDEREEYHAYMAGPNMQRVLWNFDQQFLRNKLKYTELTEAETKIYQEVRDKLWELIKEEEIENLF
jgi:hypothetical protein